jgi:3-dehydroquinate synthase
MLTTPVLLGDRSYNVLTGQGLLASTGSQARSLFPLTRRCAIITDSNVGPLYADTVADSLRSADFEPTTITVPAGEPSKSFSCLESVCRAMVSAGLDRKSFAIALGGGVIGDLAGFAASIFFRGIPFLQIPTTIVSVVDSSVGGKTGINTPEGKNLIGSFHQPKLVLIDPATLLSLPDREYHEGFAEVIKHAAIRDAPMLDVLASLAQNPSRLHLDALIARNVAIKASIVSEDEFETKDVRALLNFGHTIGHGIEASAGYGQFLHGEAISLGIRAALSLSTQFASLSPHDALRITQLLHSFHLPLTLPTSIPTDTILSKLARDKKFDQGHIKFILLNSPGHAFVSSAITLPSCATAINALRTPPDLS